MGMDSGLLFSMMMMQQQSAAQAQQNAMFENITNRNYAAQEREQARLDKIREEEKAAEAATKAAGEAGYKGLLGSTETQLRKGLLNYTGAVDAVRSYRTKYGLTPSEEDVTSLTNLYTNELQPQRQKTGIQSAYQETLGRDVSESELQTAQDRFNQGYYTSVDDLKSSLYKGKEYTDKFNTSYLDNYYDTMFGKQTVDAEGKKTGQRTFKFNKSLLPSYDTAAVNKAKINIPSFNDSTSGTPQELQEQIQNVRDTRQYLYSAGLTNLQGEIDKETQSLKNEGAKELARIEQGGGLYRQLVGAFNFS